MDWQNVYRLAREAFRLQREPGRRGVFDPLALAQHLAAGNRRGLGGTLTRVEIHRGLPDANRNPKGHGAVRAQERAWLAQAPEIMNVRLRPVRVNPETGRDEEKGVDVALACSAVEQVLTDTCEIAIIFSHDTDLLPAVETICRLRGPDRVETASWHTDMFRKRIPPAKQPWGKPFGVVNHTLKVEVFDRVETPIDYARLS